MHALAREKGIEPEKLMTAPEDAPLSAYKKQPGSAKYYAWKWTAKRPTSYASSNWIFFERLRRT